MHRFPLGLRLGAMLLVSAINVYSSHLAFGQPPPEAVEKLKAAAALEQKGDLVAAEAAYEKLTQEFPQLGAPWMRLAHVRHAQGDYEASVKGHLKAAEFPPFRPVALYNVACAQARLGRTDQAFIALEQAIAAGFTDRDQISSDADLASLRSDPRFEKLLPPLLTGADLFAEPARVIHTFVGEAAGDEFGWVARKIDDVDRDGVSDFVTTAPGHKNHTGKIYVYSSKSGKLLFSREGKAPGERFGNGAAGAGDANGDGTPDVIAGGPLAGAGVARLLSGKNGEVLLEVHGTTPGMRLGHKAAGLGDLNGDGCDDFAVTATQEKIADGAGVCLIYSGKDGAKLFELTCDAPGGKFGSAAAGWIAPSQSLLAVGAQDAGEGKRGRVYLYRVDASGPSLLHRWEAQATARDFGQMFLSFPGDFDGDGLADLYCSDFGDSAAFPGAGRAFIYSTSTGKLLLDLKGTQPGEGFGTSVSDAGDVNGDGVGDLIIGAWQNREAARSGGKLYLFSGKVGALLRTWTCKQAGDTLGFDATGIGDVDGDGAIDFLVTSAWSNVHGAKTGRVFILAGEK